MKNYLSYGGGVNSTALLLLMVEQEIEHEAVYVNHGGDWPETYEYIEMLSQRYPITIIKPGHKEKDIIFDSLVDYIESIHMVPLRMNRWCTSNFKIVPLNQYFQKPCFVNIGIDAGESKRAKFSTNDGIEHRWPLIEYEIDRHGCVELIKRHGLSVPMKSGCWFCPFQTIKQFKELRMRHPELFCKVVTWEEDNIARRVAKGKNFSTIFKGRTLKQIINEKQRSLMPEFEYPPCQCGL